MVAARGSVQGTSGLPRLPVGFGGEPLEETCSAQPGQVCHMVIHLLVEFHLLILEVDFEDVPETNVFCGRIQTHRSKRIWFGLFSRPPGFHPRILGGFCTWGKRARAPKVLHFRRYRACSCFSSFILGKKNHMVLLEMEAQREVGAGGRQIQVCQAANGQPHLRGITDESGSSWLMHNKGQSSNNGMGWF